MLLQGRVAKLPSHFMCPNLFFAGGRGGSAEPTGLFGGGGGGGRVGGFLGGVSRGTEAAESPPSLKAPARTLCRFAFVQLKHGLVANLNMNGQSKNRLSGFFTQTKHLFRTNAVGSGGESVDIRF